MSDSRGDVDRLVRLADAVCDETASDSELAELDALLFHSEQARQCYFAYCQMHSVLGVELKAQWAVQRAYRQIEVNPTVREPAASGIPPAPAVSAPIHLFGDVVQHTVGYFSNTGPLSYLIATVIMLVMGVAAWSWKLPGYTQVARQSSPGGAERQRAAEPTMPRVGRITGMVDCQWADPNTAPLGLAAVPMGHKYALSSGLLEITYDTGARVILQGPATYEVESSAGGYLSLGKLTARLEKGSGFRVQGSETATMNPEISNPQSPIPNPPLSTLHSPLFTVRTPTATVTDLGTEFGVEVDQQGLTTSHVFRGCVRLQLLGLGAEKDGGTVVLRENESIRTERRDAPGGAILAIRHVSVNPQTFVRRVARTPKTLDLLDVVAGGYGATSRREHGIDATTGMEDPAFSCERRNGDDKYHRVAWHKLIDGVFTPSGGKTPVVVDSAGHTFAGFPPTGRVTDASIWARAASFRPDGREKDYKYWAYAMGPCRQHMPEGFGLLCLATNMGITFNLEAMRAEYRGVRPARFRAVLAVADARHGVVPLDVLQEADVWVLVDGQLKLSRPHFHPQDGAIKVNVELGPRDRFLTLVSTWGGNAHNLDWVVFGDPVLEMVRAEEDHP